MIESESLASRKIKSGDRECEFYLSEARESSIFNREIEFPGFVHDSCTIHTAPNGWLRANAEIQIAPAMNANAKRSR